jgi:hypothetical protein
MYDAFITPGENGSTLIGPGPPLFSSDPDRLPHARPDPGRCHCLTAMTQPGPGPSTRPLDPTSKPYDILKVKHAFMKSVYHVMEYTSLVVLLTHRVNFITAAGSEDVVLNILLQAKNGKLCQSIVTV